MAHTHPIHISLSLTHTCAPHTHTMNTQYSNNNAPGSPSQSDEGVHEGPDGVHVQLKQLDN